MVAPLVRDLLFRARLEIPCQCGRALMLDVRMGEDDIAERAEVWS